MTLTFNFTSPVTLIKLSCLFIVVSGQTKMTCFFQLTNYCILSFKGNWLLQYCVSKNSILPLLGIFFSTNIQIKGKLYFLLKLPEQTTCRSKADNKKYCVRLIVVQYQISEWRRQLGLYFQLVILDKNKILSIIKGNSRQ